MAHQSHFHFPERRLKADNSDNRDNSDNSDSRTETER
jgi:hypothetical protein